MDKQSKSLVLFPAMTKAETIPDFFVYGEPSRSIDVDFMHVETVMERRSLHFGNVAPHRHQHMAQVIFWYKGGGTYRYEETVVDFSAPAVGFMPSGVVHGFSVGADADAIVLSIADGGLRSAHDAFAVTPERAVFVAGDAGQLAFSHLASLSRLILEEYRVGDRESISVMTGLAHAILAHVRRLERALPARSSPAAALGLALRREIEAHFRENRPVDRYVAALATTRHLLDKAAHESFGKSVKTLVLERRLTEAKRLLLFTIRPVEDIAREIGFDDPAYFSRFFRRMAGEAPAAWRQRQLAARRNGHG
ncbi:helix-turn-helix domain-containing protein [Martelella radicis]|uniref:AraC family transcriptional activator of pobA n=1 Tax=Martelella radicis TaxID=1397476 RepID=A0A7W6PB96_9HYPH|nr:helix-turn-helix domain-containing protein [Martelella radicis]MBB4123251.1 AraC family transcriptional activator of pobA [Martelella radicis]